jgi:hypothetical protein
MDFMQVCQWAETAVSRRRKVKMKQSGSEVLGINVRMSSIVRWFVRIVCRDTVQT